MMKVHLLWYTLSIYSTLSRFSLARLECWSSKCSQNICILCSNSSKGFATVLKIFRSSTPMSVVQTLPAPTLTVTLQSVLPSQISNIFTTDLSIYLFSAIRGRSEICCLEWQECGCATPANMSFSRYVGSVRISELNSVQCRHLRKHGNL